MPTPPTYPGVYIEELPRGVRTITGVATSITAFVGQARSGPVDEAVTIHSFADFERIFGGLWVESSLGFAVRDFFFNGGGRAVIVRLCADANGAALSPASFLPADGGDRKKGLFALEQTNLFNLLCIPPYTATGDVDGVVITEAAAYCERRGAMLIIDPPSGWKSKDQAKAGVAAVVGTRSGNAALFFPRLRQPNPLRGNQMEDFAPCGAVAGVFARTDAERGVWKAPAGLDAVLVGVPQLSLLLTEPESRELNSLGVNCLRAWPAVGPVVWGARTLQGDDRLASEWKYIPVRRLALYIEESLDRGTRWSAFEPNGEPLWAQIRLSIGAFLHTLFRQGAFQGGTPGDSYFVKCDAETTTQDDVNRGIVNILVGFAPLRPAEFVILKIQQCAGAAPT